MNFLQEVTTALQHGQSDRRVLMAVVQAVDALVAAFPEITCLECGRTWGPGGRVLPLNPSYGMTVQGPLYGDEPCGHKAWVSAGVKTKLQEMATAIGGEALKARLGALEAKVSDWEAAVARVDAALTKPEAG